MHQAARRRSKETLILPKVEVSVSLRREEYTKGGGVLIYVANTVRKGHLLVPVVEVILLASNAATVLDNMPDIIDIASMVANKVNLADDPGHRGGGVDDQSIHTSG